MSDEILKLFIIITERARGKKVIDLLNEEGATYHTATIGHGTAPNDIAELLSLYDAEKTVVIGVVRGDKIKGIFTRLRTEQDFGAGGGIAITARLNSASSAEAVKFFIDNATDKQNEIK